MQPPAPIPLRPPRTRTPAKERASSNGSAPARPKVKRLRLALVIFGLLVLALISTVFGMMMAVAHELPALENHAEFRAARNSVLVASDGPQIAKLTGNNNRILLGEADISPNIKNAVIAIEDRRFYEHKGVDYRGIARAVSQDLIKRRAAQGASTLTQQFVKNALEAQGDRTMFQKLREAALAYHLERRWSKQKILTQYLNTVYFGNGAYGVESAVRTYFGGPGRRYGQNERISQNVSPDKAALLAGMIASPSAYDPIQNPMKSRERRDQVLHNMLDQGLISQTDYETSLRQAIPTESQINPPRPDSAEPYFSTWVTQQMVDRYGSGRVFGGGLKIKTTLDMSMQRAAEQAIAGRLGIGGLGPTASLVAIENKTGAVKAMVGGSNFDQKPFNLATNGHRQPGSSIKPFILAEALTRGYGPGSTFTSRKKIFDVPHTGGKEKFVVNNYEGSYSGIANLATATAHSDNSVYAELGLKLGTRKVARMAERLGVKTRVSTNPAMVLGGLKEGVTPLEMAYAYSTIANGGKRTSGSMASYDMGPVAVEQVEDGKHKEKNKTRQKRVLPPAAAETERQMLRGVVLGGTGVKAQIAGFAAGKTGTTENYGDAWFVGFNEKYTVAVWVGYPDKLKEMLTEYHGGPVAGGTFPTEIWHDFMTSAIQIDDSRKKPSDRQNPNTLVPVPVAPSGPQTPATPAPSTPTPGQGNGGGTQTPAPPPKQPTPQPTPAPAPQPTPQPPAGGGGNGGGTAPQ
ncbi:MAG: penicillin-binding protein [Thermoleophilaceae bacterium]|jgi:penicillin-binding protein 1A|nr:penicillin-binding protein [Thermoleophilaceae bacterium]